MAVITNFKDQVTDLAGAIPATITDGSERLFTNGIADVIRRFSLISPSILPLFASSNTFVPSVGSDLNGFGKILNVTANDGSDDIDCFNVPIAYKARVQKDSDSLFEATLNSPVFYILNGKVYTSPQYDYSVTILAETIDESFTSGGVVYKAASNNPAIYDVFMVSDTQDFDDGELETAKGSTPAANDYFKITNITSGSQAIEYLEESSISEVVLGTVTNYETGISSISSYPDEFYYLPVLYTAHFVVEHKKALLPANAAVTTALAASVTATAEIAAIITKMVASVDAGDAVLDAITTEALSIFNATIAKVETIISNSTDDWDSFITAEDPEMAQVTITGAQARLGEASIQLTKMQNLIGQGGAYSTIAQGFAGAVSSKVAEANSSLSYTQAALGNLASDMNIYTALSNSLWAQYEKAFVPYSGGK